MKRNICLAPPFFEVGPKNYLFGSDILDLAMAVDSAAAKFDVRVIFTSPYANIKEVASSTQNLFVFAPYMDDDKVGRGLANVLPESLKAAGARGVMLNHAERPLSLSRLINTMKRAKNLGMMSIVCADSLSETLAVAELRPDMMVTEPADLIGSGNAADISYVKTSMDAVLSISPDTGVLVGGGVSNGEDVYKIISAGADATGSSSGIACAKDPAAMVYEMLGALRAAWDDRKKGGMNNVKI